ncbi:helix-turn-helix transcriptional regulator [Neisseria shayeganii]|uniref:AlpA family phage regulatory protein n=1 Tax=Neisseria shayeganii TaxID=607712 RepID=A0A7D7S962_9NEIS|nr:AlpA family phage regulatory protein [Neisseria shayeganii]QMT41388.1 AlpA family phage regulatory protein [Neisseria shayeganii]
MKPQDTPEALADLPPEYVLWSASTVGAVTGLGGRTAIYNAIKNDGLPKPLRIGGRKSMWRKSDVLAWIDSRQQCLSTSPHLMKGKQP